MIHPNNRLYVVEDKIEEKQVLAELNQYINKLREENVTQYNFNNQNFAINFLRLSLIKIISIKVNSILQNLSLEHENFMNQWYTFETEFELLLLNNEKISLIYQKMISVFRQINIKEEYINKIIEMKKLERFSTSQITSIYNDYYLESLMHIPEILYVIGSLICHLDTLNLYNFYYFLLLILIQKELPITENQEQDPQKILQNIEIALVKQVTNKNDEQILKEFRQLVKLQLIFKQKQIIDFCLARYFNRYLQMVSDNYTNDRQVEISVFINIRDQSQIGKINFMLDEFKGPLKYLRGKYESNQSYEIKLIKMIQASAFVENFQQEAGNAFTVLSYLLTSISNHDFSKIHVKNCLLNNMQFFSCNFNSSTMYNVSIVSAQFINCSIQNAIWTNLESSCINISNQVGQTIFSSHPQILIQRRLNQKYEIKLSVISILNLVTDKQITSCIQQYNNYKKQSMKLSCLGQVVVILQDQNTLFWNIQAKKQIRSFKVKSIGGSYILSQDCQMMAHQTVKNYINLYKVYKAKQNLKIFVKGLPLDKFNWEKTIKFSRDNNILITKGQQSVNFWRVSDGKQNFKTLYFQDTKFRSYFLDGKYFVLIEYSTIAIWNVEEGIKLQSFEQKTIPRAKLSLDRQILVFEAEDRIFYWDIKNQQWLKNCNYLPIYRDWDIKKLSFFDDQTIVFGYNNKIIFSKMNSEKQYYCLEGQQNENFNFVFSLDKSFLISSLYKCNQTYLWNLKYYQQYLDIEFNAIWRKPSKLFLSPTNDLIGLIYDSSSIQVRSLKDLRVMGELNFHQKIPQEIILSPDFLKIAIFQDNQLFIKRIENGEDISVLKLKSKDKWKKKEEVEQEEEQQQPNQEHEQQQQNENEQEQVEEEELESLEKLEEVESAEVQESGGSEGVLILQSQRSEIQLENFEEKQYKFLRRNFLRGGETEEEEQEVEVEVDEQEEVVVEEEEVEIEEYEEVKLMAFSHNGDYLAVESDRFETINNCYSRRVKLFVFKLEGLEKIYCRQYVKDQYIYSFEFSKNDQGFAVGLTNKIQIVNINNSESKYLKDKSLRSKQDQNVVLSFSPNGQLLASGNQFCDDNNQKRKTIPEICVWRINDGEIIQRFVGHEKQIKKIEFVVDELIIVSVSEDCSIRVWNIEVGQQIQMIDFHKFGIVNLSTSSDGSTMITSDTDGLICSWRCVDNLKQHMMQKRINKYENDNLQLMDVENNKFDQGNLNVESQYHYTLFKIIGNPRFKAENCSIEGSEFNSKEGFNIRSIFLSYDDHLDE